MNILITGGAGYIGTHTCVELINKGYQIIVADNFCNSKPEAITRVKAITNTEFSFYKINVCDKQALKKIFLQHSINAVIHLAGLKSVGESVRKPLAYYHNNLYSTITLCQVMQAQGVKNLIFSSSATVYGTPQKVPIDEDAPRSCVNPYGWSKLMIERILEDIVAAQKEWSIVSLRYFNPVGAHNSGLIGEDPNGIPNNIMPYISQVAIGKRKELSIFGNDYPTPDGTGVRDYIHVVDLALGHVAAVEYATQHRGISFINLGTGKGHSVLELVKTFAATNNIPVPYKIVGRRAGDVAVCFGDVQKAKKLLNWQATRSLADMCRDAWNWQLKNPNGYVT